jgi:hypothetical protein
MELEGSSPCTKQPNTCPYSQLGKSSSRNPTLDTLPLGFPIQVLYAPLLPTPVRTTCPTPP